MTPSRDELRKTAEKQLSLMPHDREAAHLVSQDLSRGVISLLDTIKRLEGVLEQIVRETAAPSSYAESIKKIRVVARTAMESERGK
jgi:hypothetical protein